MPPKIKRRAVQPVGDQILILMDPNKTRTDGGIHIPPNAAIPVFTGRILAVSKKIKESFEHEFEPGDRIVFRNGSIQCFDLEPGDERYLMHALDVLAILPDTD